MAAEDAGVNYMAPNRQNNTTKNTRAQHTRLLPRVNFPKLVMHLVYGSRGVRFTRMHTMSWGGDQSKQRLERNGGDLAISARPGTGEAEVNIARVNQLTNR